MNIYRIVYFVIVLSIFNNFTGFLIGKKVAENWYASHAELIPVLKGHPVPWRWCHAREKIWPAIENSDGTFDCYAIDDSFGR